MDYSTIIAQELNIRPAQVRATIELLDAGNTLPFIARYRKEATGSLDEDQIRRLADSLNRLRTLDERRQTILASIEEQDKLTPELRAQIEGAQTMTALEDLYLPYRPKRRTRASIAREKGLEGLADLIIQQARLHQSVEQIAAPYLNDEVPTVEDAYAGARDIVAETISDHAGIRGTVREKALKWGVVSFDGDDVKFQSVAIDDDGNPGMWTAAAAAGDEIHVLYGAPEAGGGSELRHLALTAATTPSSGSRSPRRRPRSTTPRRSPAG